MNFSPLHRQVLAFALVGVLAAIVHFGVLIGLVEGLGWRAVSATALGYCAGAIASYLLNRLLTFRTSRSHAQAGWRFAIVAAISFGLNALLMHTGVDVLHIPYVLAQVGTTGTIMVWNFLAHRTWSFASHRA